MRCRFEACSATVPAVLTAEAICIEHFLDQAYGRASEALGCCLRDQPVSSADVEWLFSQANYSLLRMAQSAEEYPPAQRERILELLLCLANLGEFLRHHSIQLREPRDGGGLPTAGND